MEVSDVPPALRERLGTEATVSVLELFDTARQEWVPEVTTAAVERFERRVGEEVAALRTEMAGLRTGMDELRTELRSEMDELRTELRREMGDLRTGLRSELRDEVAKVRLDVANLRLDDAAARFELLKWSFVFWVSQVFAVAGVMALVLRLSRG